MCKMRVLVSVLLVIIVIGLFIQFIKNDDIEELGAYKFKKLNSFQRMIYSVYFSAYCTDDDYAIYYNDKIIKWSDQSKRPSSSIKINKNKPLTEYEFKRFRDAKIYYKEHPYTYKPYMEFENIDSNDKELKLEPNNYSLVDEFAIDFRDSLISKIEYLKYQLKEMISYDSTSYDFYTRKELIEMIISLTNMLNKTKKEEN